jgi:hypothetical protein
MHRNKITLYLCAALLPMYGLENCLLAESTMKAV